MAKIITKNTKFVVSVSERLLSMIDDIKSPKSKKV